MSLMSWKRRSPACSISSCSVVEPKDRWNMNPIQRMLVPTDFSEGSEAAADLAVQLAKQLGAAVELLTVVDTSPLLEAYGDVAYRNERITHIRSQARQQ